MMLVICSTRLWALAAMVAPSAFLLFGPAPQASAATINVTNYGAIPEDGQDDRGAIQKAIGASSPGDIIYFPAGAFDLRSSVILATNRTYLGAGGSVIRMAASNSWIGDKWLFRLNGATTNIVIEGLTFSGGAAVVAFVDWNFPNDHDYFRDLTIRNCTFAGNSSEGWFDNCYINIAARTRGLRILNNKFYNKRTIADNANDGLGLYDCSDVLVSGNYFSQLNGGGMTVNTNVNNVEFSGNVVAGYDYGAWTFFGHGLLTHGRVLNNHITGQDTNYTGFDMNQIALSLVCPSEGLLVSGNYIAGEKNVLFSELCNATNALFSQNVVEGFSWGVSASGSGLVFSNNTFRNNQWCVHVTDPTAGLRISGNMILNPRSRILGNQGPVTGCVIDNNLVLRQGGFWPDDTHETFRAIWSDDITNLVATNNIIIQTSARPPAGFGLVGLVPTGAGCNYSANIVASLSAAWVGCGVDGALSGTLTNNTFQGLARVCNNTRGTFTASGNKAIDCLAGTWPSKFIASTATTAVPTASLATILSGRTVAVTATAADSDGSIACYTYFFGESSPVITGSSSHSHTYGYVMTLTNTVAVVVKDNVGAVAVATTNLNTPGSSRGSLEPH